jgi:acetyl-CoA C-acetyltransferase
VAALTINKVCGSGLKAVMLGAQAIKAGDAEVIVAGGMESMSRAPHLLRGVREGLRMGHEPVLDSLIADGLWCSFEDCHMGTAGEVVAREYASPGPTRMATRWRVTAAPRRPPRPARSPRRSCPWRFRAARASRHASRMTSRFVQTPLLAPRGARPGLRPRRIGHVGQRSPLSDGAAASSVMSESRAAALGVTPMARIVGYATSGLSPAWS